MPAAVPTRSPLRRIAGGLLTAGALAHAAAVLVPALLGYQRYIITSGSMTGTYDRGSIVYDRVVPTRSLDVGDVITYAPPAGAGPSGLVTHRIAAITPQPGRAGVFRTEGRGEPGQAPMDVHADTPDAGARRLPPALRRLRPRGARRAEGAHGPDR